MRKAPPCIACEELLADALDGALGVVDQGWFDRHVAGCAECSTMLADAQRGAAWLELLKAPRPEPSAQLLERILAQTTGSGAMPAAQTVVRPEMVPGAMPVLSPAAVPSNLLAFRPRVAGWSQPRGWAAKMFEPRLAMTAAMAFFSVALTLNLTGVRLNEIKLGSLKPANLKHTYYEANAQAVRYYDNLRVVRVLESRVEDLRQSSQEEPVAKPTPEPTENAPAKKQEAKPEGKKEIGPGVSQRVAPAFDRPRFELTDDKIRQGRSSAEALKRMEGGLV